MFPRAIIVALAGIIVCAGSFFGTLALYDHIIPPQTVAAVNPIVESANKIAVLKSALIYDEASLRKADDNVQLEASPNLMGVLDVLEKRADGHIRLAGWVADKRGDGSPVRILAFAKGKPILDAETKGERSDVTTAFHLSPNAARNVSFELTAVCNSREALVVAAASMTNAYLPLKATVCP